MLVSFAELGLGRLFGSEAKGGPSLRSDFYLTFMYRHRLRPRRSCPAICVFT